VEVSPFCSPSASCLPCSLPTLIRPELSCLLYRLLYCASDLLQHLHIRSILTHKSLHHYHRCKMFLSYFYLYHTVPNYSIPIYCFGNQLSPFTCPLSSSSCHLLYLSSLPFQVFLLHIYLYMFLYQYQYFKHYACLLLVVPFQASVIAYFMYTMDHMLPCLMQISILAGWLFFLLSLKGVIGSF
jgi:hypothetical protein